MPITLPRKVSDLFHIDAGNQQTDLTREDLDANPAPDPTQPPRPDPEVVAQAQIDAARRAAEDAGPVQAAPAPAPAPAPEPTPAPAPAPAPTPQPQLTPTSPAPQPLLAQVGPTMAAPGGAVAGGPGASLMDWYQRAGLADAAGNLQQGVSGAAAQATQAVTGAVGGAVGGVQQSLGGAAQPTGVLQPAQAAPSVQPTPSDQLTNPVANRGKSLGSVTQFDPQLTNDEAYAACGPATAVRFAMSQGRNPTVREALDLAKTVGWTSSGGMAGLSSEKALMDKLGVATRMVGPDTEAMAREAQTGNPVTISTTGHYFFADGFDPSTGKFHVGRSGTDLKAGSEWMSAAEMQNVMGGIQGALFADNPQTPAPSTASSGTTTAAAPTSATATTAGLSGGGDRSGQVGLSGQNIMSQGAQSANWLGEQGQKALQAVLVTEGGLAGARGDGGKSAGPLQFYEGGQLANFAKQMGMTMDAAKSYVEANPVKAIEWAIGTADKPGYLGAAIQAGQQLGLKGAELATYAQQHGQVSVSPERAGANYNSLFGGGQTVINDGSTSTSSSSGQSGQSGQSVTLTRPTTGLGSDAYTQQLNDETARLAADQAASDAARAKATQDRIDAANKEYATSQTDLETRKKTFFDQQAADDAAAAARAATAPTAPAATAPTTPASQQTPQDRLAEFGQQLGQTFTGIFQHIMSGGQSPLPEATQPTPSDDLTNPIGSRYRDPNAPLESAALSAPGLAPDGGHVATEEQPALEPPRARTAAEVAASGTPGLDELGQRVDQARQAIGDTLRNTPQGQDLARLGETADYARSVAERTQVPDEATPGGARALGAAASAAGTVTKDVSDALERINPASVASREAVGGDVYATKYAAAGGPELEREYRELLQQRMDGDDSVNPRMTEITDQLAAINQDIQGGRGYGADVNQRLAEEDPTKLAVTTAATNIGAAGLTLGLTAGEAPLAARAIAEVIQPGTNPLEVLHGAMQLVSPATRQAPEVARAVDDAYRAFGLRQTDNAAERAAQVAGMDDSGRLLFLRNVADKLSGIPGVKGVGDIARGVPPAIGRAGELAGRAGELAGNALENVFAPDLGLGRAASIVADAPAGTQTLFHRLQDMPMQSADDAAKALGSPQLPEYLEGVVAYMTDQRQKLLAGELTPRDMAKAWLLTLSSMRAQARQAPRVAESLQDVMQVPERAVSRISGQRMVRPEDATAAWMLSPEGRSALDSMATGAPTDEALQALDTFRSSAGFGQPMMERAYLTSQKQKGQVVDRNWFQNLQEVTDKVNEAGRSGDVQALDKALQDMRGIGPNKTAFVKQLLGLGNGVTVDSNEINWWLTGHANARELPAKTRDELSAIARSGPQSGIPGYLQDAISGRFAELQKMGYGADIDPSAFNHVMHHWLWDTIKNATTSHEVMYDAMRNALIPAESPASTGARGAARLLSPGVPTAGRGALVGGVGGAYQASQQEGATPESILQGGLEGAGLGAVRGGVAQAATRGVLPRGALARVAQLAPQAAKAGEYGVDRLMQEYEQRTPERIASIRQRVADHLVPGIQARKGSVEDAQAMFDQIWDAGKSMLEGSRVTATGLSEKAINALAEEGRFTNKFNSADSREASALSAQAQVGAARLPTMDHALDFVRREGDVADRMALGSTQLRDADGNMDPEALNRLYAYTTSGGPLVGPDKPTAWLVWEDGQPRVVTPHHHWGVGSPNADIHRSTAPGLQSLMEGALPNATRETRTGPTGLADEVTDWEKSGIDVGGGRKIADTDAFVGPSGENDMRMATVMAGMPNDIRAGIRAGRLTDPEQIAGRLLQESVPKSSPGVVYGKRAIGQELASTAPAWMKDEMALGGADNGLRTESLIVDPKTENIKAIYIAGTRDDLDQPLANTGGRTRLQMAQAVRQRILDETGKDVPIVFKNLEPEVTQTAEGARARIPSKLISDAEVLEGPEDAVLAPGRSRIRDAYMAAGHRDIGSASTDMALQLGGAAAGGAAGYNLPEDDNAPAWERPARAAAGALFGATAPSVAARSRLGSFEYGALRSQLRPPRAVPLTGAASKLSKTEKLGAYTTANMLSGLGTAMQNTLGGMLETGRRPLGTALAGRPIDAARDVAIMANSVGEAVRAYGDTFRSGTASAVHQSKLPGGVLKPLSVPLRNLAATDAFFERLNRNGAAAVEVSRRMRENPGLSFSDVLSKHAADIEAAAEQGGKEATYKTGGGVMGEMGQQIGEARNKLINSSNSAHKALGFMLQALLPMTSVPGTVLGAGIRGAPGINEASGLLGAAYHGARAAGLRLPRQKALLPSERRAAGQAAYKELRTTQQNMAENLAIYSQVQQGNITGDGPENPSDRARLMEAVDENGDPKWRPNSVRVGGRWFDISGLGPVGFRMSAIANADDAMKRWAALPPEKRGDSPPAEIASDLAKSQLRTVSSAWYFKNLSDVLEAVKTGDPGRLGSAALGSIPDRFTPLSGALNEARRLTDPIVRNPENPIERAENRLPVLSKNVPPRYTATTGYPQEDPRDLLSTVVRGTAPGQMTPNPLAMEVARLNEAGHHVSVPLAGEEYAGAKQSRDQLSQIQQTLGQAASLYGMNVMANPAYERASDQQKATALAQAVGQSKSAADIDLGASVKRSPHESALLAWAQTPHYYGISTKADPIDIQRQNFEVSEAKSKLAAYKKEYGEGLGMSRLNKEDHKAFVLSQRADIESEVLAQRKKKLDQQLGGTLLQGAESPASAGLVGVGSTVLRS